MDENMMKKCDQLVKSLLKRSQGVHFSKPVDWKALKLPEYPKVRAALARTAGARAAPAPPCHPPCIHQLANLSRLSLPRTAALLRLFLFIITPLSLHPALAPLLSTQLIKEPMDLGTISEKCTAREYQRLEEFADDVRLVWKNAFIFNAYDSLYFKAAKTLSDVFEKRVEELEKEASELEIGTMERLNLLLEDLRANPLSEWFLEPLDPIALGIPDYPEVVKSPMDLGTIARKMERNQYMSTEDFAHDVRLVWQNAILYNSAESMFGVVAGILAQITDRRFALITRAADPGRPIPDRPGWPTFQQKKKFYDLCTRLTLADLNQMVSLVQRGCQTAVQQCGDKEVCSRRQAAAAQSVQPSRRRRTLHSQATRSQATRSQAPTPSTSHISSTSLPTPSSPLASLAISFFSRLRSRSMSTSWTWRPSTKS